MLFPAITILLFSSTPHVIKELVAYLLLCCRCCDSLFLFLSFFWVSLCRGLWQGLASGSGGCCGLNCSLPFLRHLKTIIILALTLIMLCIIIDISMHYYLTDGGGRDLLQILLLHLWLLYCHHQNIESVISD